MTTTRDSGAAKTALWLILLVTIAVQVLATFTTLSLAAIAPDVAAGLGVSAELVGYQVSLIYPGAAIGAYTTTFAVVALFAGLGMLSLAQVGRAAARHPDAVSTPF